MNLNAKTFAEEHDQIITIDPVTDVEGTVIAEHVTCETSTRLPILKLVECPTEQ